MQDKQGKVLSLTGTEYLIMKLLANAGGSEMYGLEMVESSEGRLKRGTVYVLLGRLEEKGYVKSRNEVSESAIPRRLYRLTGLGSQVYDAWSKVAEIGGLRGAFA